MPLAAGHSRYHKLSALRDVVECITKTCRSWVRWLCIIIFRIRMSMRAYDEVNSRRVRARVWGVVQVQGLLMNDWMSFTRKSSASINTFVVVRFCSSARSSAAASSLHHSRASTAPKVRIDCSSGSSGSSRKFAKNGTRDMNSVHPVEAPALRNAGGIYKIRVTRKFHTLRPFLHFVYEDDANKSVCR